MRIFVKMSLAAFAVLALVSVAKAQAISDTDLLAAASPVSIENLGQPEMGNQEMRTIPLSIAKTGESAHGLAAFALGSNLATSIVVQEFEGPETEAMDLDGPGGSTHEFEGEEEGDH